MLTANRVQDETFYSSAVIEHIVSKDKQTCPLEFWLKPAYVLSKINTKLMGIKEIFFATTAMAL